MLWLVFALGTALLLAVLSLIHRKIMFTANPYSYAFLENVVGLLIFIPMAALDWRMSGEPIAWIYVVSGGVLWTGVAIALTYSYKYTEVSIRAPIGESRTLWVLLLSALFLAEKITITKIIGVFVIIGGVALLSYKRENLSRSLNDKGIQFTLLVSFLIAIAAIIDKKALSYFSVGTYGVLMYLFPAALLSIYALGPVRFDTRQVIRKQTWLLLIVGALSAATYLLNLNALSLADVSAVYPVMRLSTVFTVLGGIILLHEREHVLQKLGSSAIVFVGVLLVSGLW
jgi:drug/metabolite transporter (DMT)-like permease